MTAGPDFREALDVAIVAVAYRSGGHVAAFVDSIVAAAGSATWHLTVVNNSPDDDLGFLQLPNGRVSVINSQTNLGFSGGLNLGLAHAPTARFIAFVNSDIVLLPGALSALARATDDGAAASVPLLVDDSGRLLLSLRREPTILAAVGEALFGDSFPGRPQAFAETIRRPEAYATPCPIDWSTGAAILVRADVVGRIGAWDAERFFLYSEETDYARRIRMAGGQIRFVPSAVVRHSEGGSGTSPQLDALLEVNKVRYFRKWHGPVTSAIFGAVVLVRNAIRPHRPGARAAARALLCNSARAALPGSLR